MWLEVLKALKSRWLPWSLLLVSVALGMLSKVGYDSEKIARQNAEATRDSTRSISTKQGEVYARLLYQTQVELTGALASAAHIRGLRPVAQDGVTVVSRYADTVAVHRGRGSVPGNVQGDKAQQDSLQFFGPPVSGVVSVTVKDSTFFWSAHLRPSPVPLALSIGCGKDGPEFTATGAPWVSVLIDPGSVEPRVCNPPKIHRSIVEKGLTATGAVFVIVKVVSLVKSIVH